MKPDIHPTFFPAAKVICSCGHTWLTGSTSEEIRTDICSNCHPFYTGEQRIVDSAGQVERFMKRLENRQSGEVKRELQNTARQEAEKAARRARARGDDPDAAAAAVLEKYDGNEDAIVEETVEETSETIDAAKESAE